MKAEDSMKHMKSRAYNDGSLTWSVGNTEIKHLVLLHKRIKGLHNFGDGRRVVPPVALVSIG